MTRSSPRPVVEPWQNNPAAIRAYVPRRRRTSDLEVEALRAFLKKIAREAVAEARRPKPPKVPWWW